MPDAKFMWDQAKRCFRLAREIMDAEVRAKLEELGREFEEKAKELEAQSDEKSTGENSTVKTKK